MIVFKDTIGDTLSGNIDGTNRVFMTRADFRDDSVNVYLNGLLLVRTWENGYTVTPPRTVTLNEAPVVGDSLEIEYQADQRTGGGALGGVPAPPQLGIVAPTVLASQLVPSILEAKEECDC